MPLIENTTFRLVAGADEEAFLQADKRVQTEFIWRQEGFVRRTTARGSDGEWLVVVLWWDEATADAAAQAALHDRVAREFAGSVDTGTVQVRRYTTLD